MSINVNILNDELCVDIVVPTFNRAHILNTTLPSFLQPNVKRLIVIDDCSNDRTSFVVNELAKKYPRIEYHRLASKGYQMAAKNMGIKISTSRYIYFADDDSVLSPDAISSMVQMIESDSKLVVAARHKYLNDSDTLNFADYKEAPRPSSIADIFDNKLLKLDLSYVVPSGISLPYCQACFMVSRDVAQLFSFNEAYRGTCYREETDFILSLRECGMKIVVCNNAIQLNLPKSNLGGGTSSYRGIYRHISEIRNEYIFFKSHGYFIKTFSPICTAPIFRSLMHAADKFFRLVRGFFEI